MVAYLGAEQPEILTDTSGGSALHLACVIKPDSAYEKIAQRLAKTHFKRSQPDTRSYRTIQHLLDMQHAVNTPDQQGQYPIHLLYSQRRSCSGSSQIGSRPYSNYDAYQINHLIEHGADIDAQDGNSDRPLMIALRQHHADILQSLLRYYPRLDVVNQQGESIETLLAKLKRDYTVERAETLEAELSPTDVEHDESWRCLHYMDGYQHQQDFSSLFHLQEGAKQRCAARYTDLIWQGKLSDLPASERPALELGAESDCHIFAPEQCLQQAQQTRVVVLFNVNSWWH